jgi:hypothetical protein
MTPARRDLARDLTGGRGVVARVLELPDRAESDGEVAMRAHAGEATCGRALKRGGVVARGGARIGEPHRKVSERHRDGDTPGAVLEALGDVLRETERGLRLLHSIETELELRAREVHVELLAKPGPARRDGERARGLTELGLGMIGAAVDRAKDRALDREARRVERVPGGWGARKRGGELACTIDATGLAVGAKESNGERRIEPCATAQHLLGPRHEELRLVGGREAIEELRDCVHRHAIHPRRGGEPSVRHHRRRNAPARRWRRNAPARRLRRNTSR